MGIPQSVPLPKTIPGLLLYDINSTGVQQTLPMTSKLESTQSLPVPSPIKTIIPFSVNSVGMTQNNLQPSAPLTSTNVGVPKILKLPLRTIQIPDCSATFSCTSKSVGVPQSIPVSTSPVPLAA